MNRIGYLGATDFAHIFNVDKWHCARRLWYEKTETAEDYPGGNEDLFALGHALEPYVVAQACERRGLTVVDELPRNPQAPSWLQGHPDAIVTGRSREGFGVLEAKTMGGNYFHHTVQEGMPKAYILQLQEYLLQTGCKWGMWALLNRDSGQIIIFDIEPEPKLQADILEAGGIFWQSVQEGDPPRGWLDKANDDGAHCPVCSFRHTCLGGKRRAEIEALAERRAARGGLPEVEDERLAKYVSLRDILDPLLKRAEKRRRFLNNAIKARLEAMGHPDGVCLSGRKISALEGATTPRWDAKAMEVDGIDVGKYRTQGISRTVRIGKGE